MNLADHERRKYADAWDIPAYHTNSPGARYADLFGRIVKPVAGRTVLDAGCGAGAGGKALAEKHALKPVYLDQVRVGELTPFIEQPLWRPVHGHYDYAYCCDVMEHIPEEFTMLCVRNILNACDGAFFSISFQPDHFGRFVGEPLHLTVKPFSWWRDRMREMGTLLDARDLIGEGVFYVRK